MLGTWAAAFALLLSVALARGSVRADAPFVVAHASPIYQDITRIALLHPGASPAIHFSTMESYHRNPDGDQFLLYAAPLATRGARAVRWPGSIEARSFAYWPAGRRHVLGASLATQILLYDPAARSIAHAFEGPRSSAWLHEIAVRGHEAFTILSAPTPVPGFEGILVVNLRSGARRLIPFDPMPSQGWGGVQTVDPTGRIWFWLAEPFTPKWHDQRGMRVRAWTGYGDGWTVESWEEWAGKTYVVLTSRDGAVVKRVADLVRLRDLGSPGRATDANPFPELLRVDLYHANDPARDALYYRPDTRTFYRGDDSARRFVRLGELDLGELRVAGFRGARVDGAGLEWAHPRYGLLHVLGLDPGGRLIVWVHGGKRYGLGDFRTRSLQFVDLDAPNASPADVTAIARGSDGAIYGSGYLTMSNMFRLAPDGSTTLLRGAVPFGEGQVNALFEGWDGLIYGVGYPDSIPFRFDPALPWRPGSGAGANPLNLGPIGRDQHRSWRGALALDGTLWYSSVSDTIVPAVRALVRADFETPSVTVRTDADDGLPAIDDLAVLDGGHLLGVGRRGATPGLYVVDQATFQVVREVPLTQAGGAIVNLDPLDGPDGRILLAQGDRLFRVAEDLSLTEAHRSAGPIARVLAGEGRDVIVVGKTQIERVDVDRGASEIWWTGRDEPDEWVFKHLSWTPVTFARGALWFADEEKLKRFDPP